MIVFFFSKDISSWTLNVFPVNLRVVYRSPHKTFHGLVLIFDPGQFSLPHILTSTGNYLNKPGDSKDRDKIVIRGTIKNIEWNNDVA